MGLFNRNKNYGTKCDKCNLDCHTLEKLQHHKNIAHSKDHDTSREDRRALQKGKIHSG